MQQYDKHSYTKRLKCKNRIRTNLKKHRANRPYEAKVKNRKKNMNKTNISTRLERDLQSKTREEETKN